MHITTENLETTYLKKFIGLNQFYIPIFSFGQTIAICNAYAVVPFAYPVAGQLIFSFSIAYALIGAIIYCGFEYKKSNLINII
jgi:hypothetical protein